MPCPDNLGTVGSNPTRSASRLASRVGSCRHLASSPVESFTQVGQQQHDVKQFAACELGSRRVVGADSGNFGCGEDYELRDFALQRLTQVFFC